MWLLSLMGRLPECTLFESTWSPAQPYLVATRVSLISSPRPGSACSAHSGVLVTIGSSTHAPRHTPVAGPPPDIFMSHFFIFLRPPPWCPFPRKAFATTPSKIEPPSPSLIFCITCPCCFFLQMLGLKIHPIFLLLIACLCHARTFLVRAEIFVFFSSLFYPCCPELCRLVQEEFADCTNE